MKNKNNFFLLILSIACCLNASGRNWKQKGLEPAPARYESFEQGVPKTWTLQGAGKLSINPWHYKLGKKSLQWDFAAGDVITVSNTIGDPQRRGLHNGYCYSSFGVWLYLQKPLEGKSLSFEFCTDDKRTGHIYVPLNFKGWQFASASYYFNKGITGSVSSKTNNIKIRAPKDCKGRVLIDLLVYNGPRYVMFANILPRKTPWKAPALDEKRFPVPAEVSDADKKAVERIKKTMLTTKINITKNDTGSYLYNSVMQRIKDLDITEDSNGIRGRPINLARDHSRGEPNFLIYSGIPQKDAVDFYYGNKLKYSFGGRKLNYQYSAALGIMRTQADVVSRGISKKEYDDLSDANIKLWKYLLDQGFNTSAGYSQYHNGTYGVVLRGVYAVKDALFAAGIMPQVFEYAQYSRYPLFKSGYISMDYFCSCYSLFYLTFLYSNELKKQIQVLRFLSNRFSNEISNDYGAVGFKVDGCGYHCTGFAFGYFKYGLSGASKLAYAMSNSSFALSQDAYNILKNCALRMYFYSSNCEVPIFMQGTGVISKAYSRGQYKYKSSCLPVILRYLALAGKNGCDKQLAEAYVSLKSSIPSRQYDDIFEKKYGIKPAKLPAGNISMPYAPLVAQRRDNWLAVAWGGGIDMRQRGNHYMYHGGNGPLSILDKDGFRAGGTEEFGWDWNRTNGATVLYMPDVTGVKFTMKHKLPKDKKYLKKLMDKQVKATRSSPLVKRGNGGISWRGANGCFRRIFRGDKFYNDFSGIKSYFFINDRIYALGSNIVSDNKKYHVQTNLYQKALYKSQTDAKGNLLKKLALKDSPTYVDGGKITEFPVADKKLDTGKPHHLIDPVGNGYFIPAGQKLFVARKTQKSRTSNGWKHLNHSGDFATAWLDHGIACKNGKYAYVVFPYCNKKEFAKFGSKGFEILRQDSFAHILHDKINGFYAGIFFKGGTVKKLPHIKAVQRDCQIMYKENGSKLEIAVGDPDPHRNWTNKTRLGNYGGKSELTPLKVTFAGKWKLKKVVDGIKILGTGNNSTVVEFACIHGRTFNFTLSK